MRASNIELLRIISMILIIMHHFSVHGCFPFTPDLTFNKVFLQVFGLGGKAAVVAFVMITGYFMVSSTLQHCHVGRGYGFRTRYGDVKEYDARFIAYWCHELVRPELFSTLFINACY